MIGGCPQDPHIFVGTIAANLRLARPDATDDELADAAARARLLPWIQLAAARPADTASARAAPPSPAASASG